MCIVLFKSFLLREIFHLEDHFWINGQRLKNDHSQKNKTLTLTRTKFIPWTTPRRVGSLGKFCTPNLHTIVKFCRYLYTLICAYIGQCACPGTSV